MKNHKILFFSILALLIIILFYIAFIARGHTVRNQTNICRGYLTDNEYLEI